MEPRLAGDPGDRRRPRSAAAQARAGRLADFGPGRDADHADDHPRTGGLRGLGRERGHEASLDPRRTALPGRGPSPAVGGGVHKPPKAFEYGGVGFARHFGHVSCVAWREGGPFRQDIRRVCQFNAPGEVTVALAGRTISYQPGVAQPVTVTIAHGQPSCVMAGWFRN